MSPNWKVLLYDWKILLIVVHPVSSFDAEDIPARLRNSPAI